jgi:hypothetical protein
MIGFIVTSITITINYNSSQSVTRSIPYWTTSVFSFTLTDLVLICYESVTSSASVVRWSQPNIELPYESRMIELS